MQQNRYSCSNKHNSDLSSKDIARYISLEAPANQLLLSAAKKLDLSARSYFKTIKVARTIADLEGSDSVLPSHVAEALQYRQISAA